MRGEEKKRRTIVLGPSSSPLECFANTTLRIDDTVPTPLNISVNAEPSVNPPDDASHP